MVGVGSVIKHKHCTLNIVPDEFFKVFAVFPKLISFTKSSMISQLQKHLSEKPIIHVIKGE